jgi:membrane dipeptidase
VRAAECNRPGMVIDRAHATFETTAGVLGASRQPVMVVHSHLDHPGGRHPRLLSPAHARVVADAGGLIGAWPSGVTSTSLADFADEIARLADLVGTGHVAIGTKMDTSYRPVLISYAGLRRPSPPAGRPQPQRHRDRPDPRYQRLDLMRTVTARPS